MYFKYLLKLLVNPILLIVCFISFAQSEIVKTVEINGNDRISNETIIMFSSLKIGKDYNEDDLNELLKDLYDTRFFKNISVSIKNNKILINVIENPIIENILFEGIKSSTMKDDLTKNLNLRSRSSFDEIILKEDRDEILFNLKKRGYYFSSIDVLIEELDENKVDVIFKISLGKKAKIKKISFIGDKKFKDRKLRNIIVSEEYKFWKFVSGRKYLNENVINLDNRLLKNFYLNQGYYNVEINSSFAKLIDNENFELIYNINANEKFYFGDIALQLPDDFDDQNFSKINKVFDEIKGEKYSINSIQKILDEIDKVSIYEQYESVKAVVEEKIDSNKINLNFKINQTEKFTVERINIFGNNITRENVIRNELELDEGDPYNEILFTKSKNNLKSLNFFKNVNAEVIDLDGSNNKIINITVDEKPTGEISAGAGIGTNGETVMFGIKENNYLGKGVKVNANATLSAESLKGILQYTDPKFRNSDKSVSLSLQANEDDKLEDFGYKSNRVGSSFVTNFEYLDDLNFGLGVSSFYERIETNSTASSRQQKQAGNHFDTFLKLDFDYDKRNQKFKTSEGYRSFYSLDLPLISDTNTLINSYNYKFFTELYENNLTSLSFLIKSSNSLTNDNIKLSERLFVPSRNLRGFESGKIGPKDGNDFIGGNYVSAINFSSSLPAVFQQAQNVEFLFFLDAANVWGVDYDSSLDQSNKIRSSVGLAVDWFTPVGPLNFSLSQPLSKHSSDITETFRFNLGTTF